MKNSAAPARVHEGDGTKQRAGFFGSAPPIPGFNPRSEDAVAHRFRGIAPQWLVLGAGAVSILIYMGFVFAFPLTTWWNHPHTSDLANSINDMGRITGYSPFAAIGFVTAIVLLFACQFVAMLAGGKVRQIGPASRRDRFVRALILFLPLLFAAVMIWMQPVTTTDLYGYVARGYIQAHLHQNPMTNPASLLPGGLSVDRPPSPYGPLWLLVTWAVSALGGEDLLANMLAYKLIGFVALALTIWLVDLLARALCPERRLRVAALVGWCPLILFDSIGNAHNDLVMMVCVLAAFELMRRDHPRWAVFFFVIGALIKYVSIIFLPLWFVYELRRRIARATPEETACEVDESETESPEGIPAVVGAWIRGAAATVRQVNPRDVLALLTPIALIGLPLAILAYAPYWHGLSTFTGLGQQLRPLYYNSSIVGFISGPLQIVVPSSQDAALDKTLRLIFYALFFIYAYMQTTRLWSMGRKMTLHDVLTAAAKITFAALLLITFWFQPWYVTWLIPLAALAREPFVRRQGTILALGALLTYAVGNFLFVNESDLAHDLFVQFFEIMVAFGPLLLLRAAPYESGWSQVIRRYLGMLGQGLTQRPIFWERVMVVLIVVVAALLRLIRLGNIFSTIPAGSNEASVLAQVGSDLRLGLADPQGLHGPFDALQALLVHFFGRTPFAVLLPSAIFGSLTVIAIYLLTFEIMRQGKFPGKRPVAILAALLAATSHWHVSLSRSGMELVVLPLLMCMALYWLLLALRSQPRGAQSPSSQAQTSAREERDTPLYRARNTSTPLAERLRVPSIPLARRRMLYFILSGVCTGLACDLAPGLWLVPLIVAGFLGMWHLRRPKGHTVPREGVIALVVTTLIVGSPVIWQYLNRVIGFAPGSPFLAKTTVLPGIGPTPLSPPFWVVVARNIADVLNVLVSQDYTAGYPAIGGAPIIPLLLGPFFFIGLLVIVVRWRRFESLALLLLTALPLVASVAVGTPTGAIEAASVLPAMCIVPAYGLYVVGLWLSHLPIVLDRINGVRVFSTPEQIGRMLLLAFLVVSAIRTFFWYFEATLPAHQAQWTPSFIGSHLALIAPDVIMSHLAAIFFR